MSQSIDSAKTGAVSLVSGGAVLYAGVLFLLGAAAFALALVVPFWAGWLIVGAATTIVGFIMVQTGKRRFSENGFAPNRAVDALRKDSGRDQETDVMSTNMGKLAARCAKESRGASNARLIARATQ